MYFKSLNVLLLHPGRTGGTTVEQLVWRRLYPGNPFLLAEKEYPEFLFGYSSKRNAFLQHFDFEDSLKLLGEIDLNLYSVSSVRNSWERVFSIYTYPGPYENKTFGEYLRDLENYMKARVGRMWNDHWFKSQINFVETNGRKVDQIIYQDKLYEGIEIFLKRFELPPLTDKEKEHFKIFNSYKRTKKMDDFYTQEQIDLVGELFEAEIKYFNFKAPALVRSK
jgi:hypothetical protein